MVPITAVGLPQQSSTATMTSRDLSSAASASVLPEAAILIELESNDGLNRHDDGKTGWVSSTRTLYLHRMRACNLIVL